MKATKIVILTLILSISFALSAQKKEERKVDTFTSISSSGGIDVEYTIGSTISVVVEANEADLSNVITEVEDGNLKITKKGNTKWSKNGSRRVYVTTPTLKAITFSGGSDFDAAEIVCDSKFKVAFTGGSDLKIGKLTASEFKIAMAGGSDYSIKEAKVGNCKLAASGGSDGDINITSEGKLSIALSGGSDLKVKGSVKDVEIAASGASDINVSGLKYENITSQASGASEIKK